MNNDVYKCLNRHCPQFTSVIERIKNVTEELQDTESAYREIKDVYKVSVKTYEITKKVLARRISELKAELHKLVGMLSL